jgi:hypothetical protein
VIAWQDDAFLIRKRVETSLSQITALFAVRTLRAVTPRYFELKIGLTILAFAI